MKFYRKHDPPRVQMVGQILTDYPFQEVVKSLQAKYKEVPPGWEKALPGITRLGRLFG